MIIDIGHRKKELLILLLLFHFTVFFGYSIGFLNLFYSEHTTPNSLRVQIQGMTDSEMEQADEMVFGKSIKELITTTHNHVLALSVIFLLVGGVGFLLHQRKWLFYLTIELFVSLFMTFGSIWMIKAGLNIFSYVAMISGMLMHLSFILILFSNGYGIIILIKKASEKDLN
ncbi:MAG: hypothetical protein Kow00108_10410 [Calditrichia bacterium]